MRALTFFRGLASGAALMYWFDPAAGRRRRARARHKLAHLTRQAAHDAGVLVRDLTHRVHGVACSLQALGGAHDVSGEVLEERVRARLGRLCSHPHAIEVHCRPDGVVLRGPVLAAERSRIVRGVRRVPGVSAVIDEMEPHEEPGRIPALQGGRPRTGRGARGPLASALTLGLGDRTWTPTARAVVGTAGVGLILRGLRGGGLWGLLEGAAGLALLARTASTRGVGRYTTLEGGRPAVIVRKAVHVQAPVPDVYRLWRRPEVFPRFMKHVAQVRRLDGGRYAWRVSGPFGIGFEWTAELVADEPDRLLAWRTAEGSDVESEGQVRFSALPDGGTLADVQFSYRPPGGLFGHALGTLLGAGPKRDLDEDLLRLKSLLEIGKATGREGTVTREEIAREAQPPEAPASPPPS
jgi:uncharacterized membrane protein